MKLTGPQKNTCAFPKLLPVRGMGCHDGPGLRHRLSLRRGVDQFQEKPVHRWVKEAQFPEETGDALPQGGEVDTDSQSALATVHLNFPYCPVPTCPPAPGDKHSNQNATKSNFYP